MKRAGDHFARVEPATLADWRAWLAAQHTQTDSIWLVYRKKAAGGAFSASEAVDEALCFGWIDSLPRSLDDARSQLLFSPRKPGSGWSKVNKDKIARLEAQGRIAPPGRAVIEAARADGSWDKLKGVDDLMEPDDLRAALDAAGAARGHWEAFPKSARRGILEWILNAKRPETRAKRIADTAALAAHNKRANQWPR